MSPCFLRGGRRKEGREERREGREERRERREGRVGRREGGEKGGRRGGRGFGREEAWCHLQTFSYLCSNYVPYVTIASYC